MNKESEEVYLSIPNPSGCSLSNIDSLRLQRYTEVKEGFLTDELKSIFSDLRSVILVTNPPEIQIQVQSIRSVEKMSPSKVQDIEATPRGTDASFMNAVRYAECRKNHAASIGGYAVDGCGEFMASGEEGTAAALKCAACNCHRSFHRREVENETLRECQRTRT